jgi:Holliday junction resolvase RusA-like endonuclease
MLKRIWAVRMIIVHIPGVPIPKGRARFTRTGHAYTPARTRSYEAVVQQAAVLAMRGKQPIKGPVDLSVQVTLPIPASWPAKARALAADGGMLPTSRPDLDNYIKVCDALNTIVWADDAQVVLLSAFKIYGNEPALTIVVTEVNRT